MPGTRERKPLRVYFNPHYTEEDCLYRWVLKLATTQMGTAFSSNVLFGEK